jgi:hypothetical protein
MSDAQGERISINDGRLQVPDYPIIPFIEGDGTGPDIWRASVRVFEAAVARAYGGRKRIVWKEVLAGQRAFDDSKNWLPDETVEAKLLEPGKVYALQLDRMLTSNVFLKGHRIRVQVSGSFYPHFSRNLQTGESEIVSAEMKKAVNLNRLAYFAAVVDTGSFTRAADRLGMPGPQQSMSTRRIALLREASAQLDTAKLGATAISSAPSSRSRASMTQPMRQPSTPATTGIVPFMDLMSRVMSLPEYKDAPRVFVIVDNGSDHRGQAAVKRLRDAWPNAIMIHTPVHASWLNQAEIFFSVTQKKVLTSSDFASLEELAGTLLAFVDRYNQGARPFNWRFTAADLARLLDRISAREDAAPKPAELPEAA